MMLSAIIKQLKCVFQFSLYLLFLFSAGCGGGGGGTTSPTPPAVSPPPNNSIQFLE